MAQLARVIPASLPDPADEIVVLRSTWSAAVLGKSYRVGPDGSTVATPYRAGRFFLAETLPLNNVRELHAAWAYLADHGGAFAVRGALSGAIIPAGTPAGTKGSSPLVGDHVTRRVSSNPDGHPAGLRDVARHWLFLDLDRIPNLLGLDPRVDPEAVVEYVLGLLPRAIRRAASSWDWSSSTCVGVPVGEAHAVLSIHIRVWLDTPLAHLQARCLLEGLDRFVRARLRSLGAETPGRVVDWKVSEPQQPLYLAAPRFEGIADPFPGQLRRGLRDGADEVRLADLDAELERTAAAIASDVVPRPRKAPVARARDPKMVAAPVPATHDPASGAEVVPLAAMRRLVDARLVSGKGSLRMKTLADRGIFAARVPLEVVRLVRGRVAAGATDPRWRAWHEAGGVPEGLRDTYVFLTGCVVVESLPKAQLTEAAANAAVLEIGRLIVGPVWLEGCWNGERLHASLAARAAAAGRGEKETIKGADGEESKDPRYQVGRARLLKEFDVQRDEVAKYGLLSLATSADRLAAKRLAKGARPRDVVQAANIELAAKAKKLMAKGTSQTAAAVAVGLHEKQLRRILLAEKARREAARQPRSKPARSGPVPPPARTEHLPVDESRKEEGRSQDSSAQRRTPPPAPPAAADPWSDLRGAYRQAAQAAWKPGADGRGDVPALPPGAPEELRLAHVKALGAIADARRRAAARAVTTYPNIAAPCWLKLVHLGDAFTAYTSPDGATWTPLGLSVSASLTPTLLVGLAASASAPLGMTQATFTNVSTTSLQQGTGTTLLTSSLDPSTSGQSVTFTATVAGASPTGTVTFTLDGTPQPAVILSGGVATFTPTALAQGPHSLAASYSGDANNVASQSNPLTQTVLPPLIVVSPASTVVSQNAVQHFAAVADDQSGTPLSPQPSFTWAVGGGGTISPTGLFIAGPSSGGPFTVTASAGGGSGTATVSVNVIQVSPLLQINAGGPAVAPFAADAYFTGGSANSTGAAINVSAPGAAPMAVYQTGRYGTFSYAFPNLTPGGSYQVRLHFAETYWNQAGKRLQNVTVNGAAALTGFDIFAAAGAEFKAVVETVPATADSSGKVTVAFAHATGSSDGNALVAGLELLPPAAPAVAVAASATPNPVTGTTAAVSVLGADAGGEGGLTYAWSATGPAPVTFSASGTNAAKNSVATFTQAGSYTLTVTIADAHGATLTGGVVVTVLPTLTAIAVSPSTASVGAGQTQPFTATASDQFGSPLSPQPAFAWAVSGGGTITGAGLFTAGSATGGPVTVTASAGGGSGTASVTVTGRPVLQINAGGPEASPFAADKLYAGGSLYSSAAPVGTAGAANAAPASVYQTERYGNFSYVLSGLTPGAPYTVRLHFAEIYWSASGKRLFNVKINGAQVLTNFDVFATAGGMNKALVESFPVTASGSGVVTVQFVSVRDNAKVSGIEVLTR